MTFIVLEEMLLLPIAAVQWVNFNSWRWQLNNIIKYFGQTFSGKVEYTRLSSLIITDI